MSDSDKYTAVSERAHALMAVLAAEVPGDLGRVLSAILGAESDDPIGSINPPAKAIGWATQLLALCCEAYGQPVDRAVPVGACLELFGIAAVVLDAAQDGHEDLLSRYLGASDEHSLALGQVWDRRAAIVSNASVGLIGLFWRALLEHGPAYGVEQEVLISIGRLLAERLVRICYGQHLDLTAGCDPKIGLDEYEQIIRHKTGEIDGLACEVGALLACADHQRELWHTLGLERAVTQQLYDDYVDLAEDLTGGRQVNHPVIYGLTVGSDDEHKAILSLLETARGGGLDAPEAVVQLAALLRTLGVEHYTLACMMVHHEKAMDALEALQLPSEEATWLHLWVMQADPFQSPMPSRELQGSAH